MVASSLQAARNLVKKCEFGRDATRATNGVLIGRGETSVILRDEEPNIEACLFTNFEIREIPYQAVRYKSAYLPLHNVDGGGTVYKTRNEVILPQAGHEIVVKIIHFYLLCDETHQISVAIVDRYKSSEDSNGATLRHPLSDGIIVQPSETNFCFLLRDINRKVMLYPYQLFS